MNLDLVIASRQRTKKINARRLRLIVTDLLARLEVTEAGLGIHLVGAKEMARINWQFLQHKGSTDVITFDHSPPSPSLRSPPSKLAAPSPGLHGELYVCIDDAVAQAREFKTTWQSEVVRYVVHGVLHLLGHDDLKPALRRKMKRAENRLVRDLGARFSFAQLSAPAKLRP